MQLFLRYELLKRYCENLFVTLFYNKESKLFIRFVSKKDLNKCSILLLTQIQIIRKTILPTQMP